MTDGLRLRCYKCSRDWGIRHGSLLEQSNLPLAECAWLLRAFEAAATVTQVAHLFGYHVNTVSHFWQLCRNHCATYMFHHPIRFPPDEIVEIDELYLPALQPIPDAYEEQPPPRWVIGCIGRNTGWVALDIADDHTTATIRPLIESHLPHNDTITITDKHPSFKFLEEDHPHYWAVKQKAGSAMWAVPFEQQTRVGTIVVHSNTIEGYWSQFRRRLHDSHGWPAEYIPLVLCEHMFRSLHIPLTAAIAAF
jgi:hypothetical protein